MGSSNTQTGSFNLSNPQVSPNAAPTNPYQTNQFVQDFYNKYGFNQGEDLTGLNLGSFASLFNQQNQSSFPNSGLNGGTQYNQLTANLGANLSPQFYDPAIASQLPSNMSGGGGGVVSAYGNAPWVNQGQRNLSGQMMQAGPDPSVNWSGGNNYFNTPAGMYNPYLGQSSVMPAFGPVNNPYGGFNPQINSYANGVDSYLNQLRAPQYPPTEPTTDTSPGSPFAGQQVVHGNTPGWQSAGGDYTGAPQAPYQAAPGTQVDPGVQANTLGRRELMRQQMMQRYPNSRFFQRPRANFWGR